MYLGEIAHIRMGLVLTRKKAEVSFDVRAQYPVISLKNIEADGTFTDEPFDMFNSKDVLGDEHFTRAGDVLIRLNHPYTTVLIEEGQEGLLIPSYFAQIQIVHPSFLPSYVAWYLNTELVKNKLLKYQTGTNIPSTNKQILEQLPVPELELDRQKAITRLQQLYRKEKRLLQELMQEKARLYQAVLHNIAGLK